MRAEDGIITQLFEGCFQRPPSPPHSCRPLRNTLSPDSLERTSQSRTGCTAGGDSRMSWRPPPPRTLHRAKKKKKDPDADVCVHSGGRAGGQNATWTFILLRDALPSCSPGSSWVFSELLTQAECPLGSRWRRTKTWNNIVGQACTCALAGGACGGQQLLPELDRLLWTITFRATYLT